MKIIISALLCLACIFSPHTYSQNNTRAHATNLEEFLALPAELTTLLDREIKPLRSSEKRTFALYEFLFSQEKLGLRYTFDSALTAKESFERREGNCLSLAALFIASARYVGLKASFQNVDIPESWERREDYYLLPGHTNALVSLPGKRLHIEFMRTFFSNFESDNAEVISDNFAFAQYQNNLSVHYLAQGDLGKALHHSELTLKLYPALDSFWSNHGVILKFLGKHQEAETMYRKALKMNKANFSAMTNLYILLSEENRNEEAQELSKKVDRHSKRNPHHLAKLAEISINSGHLEEALTNIHRAIRKNDSIPYFFDLEATIFSALGKDKAALNALKTAVKLAKDSDEEMQYQKKLRDLLGKL